MVKAYGYIRVSTEDQAKKETPEAQRHSILEWAKANGYEIIKWYEDTISGKTDKRPEYDRMALDLEDGIDGAEAVIIYKLDRLARKVIVQETMIEMDFQRHNIELVSVTEGRGLQEDDDFERVMFRQIKAVFAEYERKIINRRCELGRERKLRDIKRENELRKREGKKPIPMKCGGRKSWAEICPEVVSRVREIKRKTPKISLSDIAMRLNDEGFVSPVKNAEGENQFTKGMVRNIARHIY